LEKIIIKKNKMADFKQNITKVTDEHKKKYYKDFKWKMPGDINKYIGERERTRDTSMKGQKERLEGQLELRKKYVELLEEKENLLKKFIDAPSEETKLMLDVVSAEIDLHNISIEIVAQKNVYVDTYIYYKEDFMRRFEDGEKDKKVNNYKK
tara:strand:+ start:143 stop:598 length:456 start_codon:yes stop_codon:yes gene_type:complete